MTVFLLNSFFSPLILINLVLLILSSAAPLEGDTQTTTPAVCPCIINRQGWNARNATDSLEKLKSVPVPYVVIHHGGIMHYCYDRKSCSQIVRSYQDLHIDVNSWIDIGYNFVIGEDGNIYEGRGWDFRGAHAPGYNTQSIGVSFIGDFSHFIPNTRALKALDALIACGVALKKISEDYHVIGHRQSRDTVCPGEVFYNYIITMPRWTSHPVPTDGPSEYNKNSTYIYYKTSTNPPQEVQKSNRIITVV